ncbi:hypothetical protein D0N36_04380 [Hymenobacter lapidiphilus]|uniref:hypothetical protein n=1 Tax=Hymenobacter sp. CCM 8763 TaxID=2303334 RepID=UPI000E351950|nr:hypothetical protein [Hymenobacter sp. CCM 8763]RFP66261.1 hypothetical protein D0N36_04380 [Hymenobacter sp. CCM 8763]
MKFCLPSLLLLLLTLLVPARAQTAPGQPTLDEQKVQIWCATVRYVYDDNGRPNLKSKLNCGGSLKALENSIKADSQKVYSLLYRPLEGQGEIYKGLNSNEARLQKLTSQIVAKLKSSAARRANPARMERLTALETALTTYVKSGTPIGTLAATEAPENTADFAADDTTVTDAGLSEAGVTGPGPARPPAASESVMDKLFAPLALIMALLSLVLFWLMSRKVAALAERLGQLRPLAAPTTASPAGHLTATQRREVEQLVDQLVAQRMAADLAEAPAPAEPATPAVFPASAFISNVLLATPSAPIDTPAPVQTQAAATVVEAPVALSAVPAPPLVMPAGSPATAPRDEFTSLVPPVPLPATAAAEPEPAAQAQFTRYAAGPVDGAFHEADLTPEPQPDSRYQLYFDPQWPELATFSLAPDFARQAQAVANQADALRGACRFEPPTGPVSHVLVEEEGVLSQQAGRWQLEQLAGLRFE